MLAAAVLAQFEHRAEIVVRREDRRLDPRLLHFLDVIGVRHIDRIVDFQLLAVAQLDLVDHRGRGRDQIEIEFALEPLLDDLQMQEPEEAAAEAEAERGGGLHLVGKAGVVQSQLAHGRAEVLKVRGVDRKQAAEHHRDRGTETGQRRGHRLFVVGDGVADAGVGHFLDRGGEKADLAGAELVELDALGREHADAVDLVSRVGAHHADALAFFEHAVDDAEQHDDAEIAVVPASRRAAP